MTKTSKRYLLFAGIGLVVVWIGSKLLRNLNGANPYNVPVYGGSPYNTGGNSTLTGVAGILHELPGVIDSFGGAFGSGNYDYVDNSNSMAAGTYI